MGAGEEIAPERSMLGPHAAAALDAGRQELGLIAEATMVLVNLGPHPDR